MLENLQPKDSNNCSSDNLDGTYTICMGSKLSATLHKQHQQMTAAAANGRRFVNVDRQQTHRYVNLKLFCHIYRLPAFMAKVLPTVCCLICCGG